MADKTPKGVLAVFTDENGRVIANAADFAPDRPGGFKMIEAQRQRARVSLAGKVMNAYASPALVRAIEQYDAEQILRKLVGKHGCRVTMLPVGYTDDEAENL